MMVVRKMACFTDTGKVLSPFIRKMGGFTDGAFAFMMVIRKMGGFTDERDRFEEIDDLRMPEV